MKRGAAGERRRPLSIHFVKYLFRFLYLGLQLLSFSVYSYFLVYSLHAHLQCSDRFLSSLTLSFFIVYSFGFSHFQWLLQFCDFLHTCLCAFEYGLQIGTCSLSDRRNYQGTISRVRSGRVLTVSDVPPISSDY